MLRIVSLSQCQLVVIMAMAACAAACVPEGTLAEQAMGGSGTGMGGRDSEATGGSSPGNAGTTDLGSGAMGGLTSNGGDSASGGSGGSTGGSSNMPCEGAACACDGGLCIPNLNAGRDPILLADIAAGNGGGFVITGVPNRRLGEVSSGQDTNADGRSDILIGAEGDGSNLGAAYVVWGEGRTAPISLINFVGQGHGYPIEGPTPQFGRSVSMLRDVNRDDRGDFVIATAVGGIQNDGPQTDYVIFGNQAGTTVSAATAGQLGRGYSIAGTARQTINVAGAGDQNGDGREDIATPLHVPNGGPGRLLVSFGQSGQDPVSGFEIVGTEVATAINGIASAGDVNGDGRPDILIAGARTRNNSFGYVAWLVFGSAVPGTVQLVDIEAGIGGGFVINEARFNDLTAGASVAGLGDINGDGLDDVLIGASGAPANDGAGAGRAYVVFGKRDPSPVNLQTVESGMEDAGGFVINGYDNSDAAGASVSGIGDQNGDGVRDLVIGVPGAEGLSEPNPTGITYVVYGKSDFTPVELSVLRDGGDGGFAIVGAAEGEAAGSGLATGDINGDGIDDVVVGAIAGVAGDGTNGLVYVVFGNR